MVMWLCCFWPGGPKGIREGEYEEETSWTLGNKRVRTGPGSQSSLQGHIPNDLTFSLQVQPPKGSITSKYTWGPSLIHMALGRHSRSKLQDSDFLSLEEIIQRFSDLEVLDFFKCYLSICINIFLKLLQGLMQAKQCDIMQIVKMRCISRNSLPRFLLHCISYWCFRYTTVRV